MWIRRGVGVEVREEVVKRYRSIYGVIEVVRDDPEPRDIGLQSEEIQ